MEMFTSNNRGILARGVAPTDNMFATVSIHFRVAVTAGVDNAMAFSVVFVHLSLLSVQNVVSRGSGGVYVFVKAARTTSELRCHPRTGNIVYDIYKIEMIVWYYLRVRIFYELQIRLT